MDSNTRTRIEDLVNSSPIMVFMKGTKLMPQCGFSNNVVQILNSLGIEFETFDVLSDMEIRQGIKEYSEYFDGVEYNESQPEPSLNQLWNTKADVALPCATQNEVNSDEAKMLVDSGVMAVAEGANMPCTPEAVACFQKNGVLFAPGKASNAGGVATSGLEMSQNSLRLSWSREEVDQKLEGIMVNIHKNAFETAERFGTPGDYVNGANIAGFIKIAESSIAQGIL